MQIIDSIPAMQAAGESIALVPTMGYLHEGHTSLTDIARATDDRVVVSMAWP
jgi:pantoate--beta-alanine ligase